MSANKDLELGLPPAAVNDWSKPFDHKGENPCPCLGSVLVRITGSERPSRSVPRKELSLDRLSVRSTGSGHSKDEILGSELRNALFFV